MPPGLDDTSASLVTGHECGQWSSVRAKSPYPLPLLGTADGSLLQPTTPYVPTIDALARRIGDYVRQCNVQRRCRFKDAVHWALYACDVDVDGALEAAGYRVEQMYEALVVHSNGHYDTVDSHVLAPLPGSDDNSVPTLTSMPFHKVVWRARAELEAAGAHTEQTGMAFQALVAALVRYFAPGIDRSGMPAFRVRALRTKFEAFDGGRAFCVRYVHGQPNRSPNTYYTIELRDDDHK